MLHICAEHIQDSFCVSVCERMNSALQKPRQTRSKRCTDQQEDNVKHLLAGLRAKSEQKYCVHDQPSTPQPGQILRTTLQDTECALPQAYSHGNSASLFRLVEPHILCFSSDCAMRGLGEVTSKIVLYPTYCGGIHFFLVSSFPPPFFPPDVCLGVGVLSQLWLLRTEAHMQRKGLATPNHHQLPPPSQPASSLLQHNTDKYFRSQ